MKTKKRKLSKKKITKLFILLLVVILVIVAGVFLVNGMTKKKEEKKVKVVDNIESHGYTLDENESKYYKKLFDELKETLNEKEVDEEKYASLVTQLFLSDFFQLENKISKNDVGGVQFIYQDFRSDFEKYAKDTVYKYLENNTYEDRKQELPKVKEVTIVSVEKTAFEYLEQTDENAYVVEATITYEENLGYQENATLTLIHSNDRLEIAKMTK